MVWLWVWEIWIPFLLLCYRIPHSTPGKSFHEKKQGQHVSSHWVSAGLKASEVIGFKYFRHLTSGISQQHTPSQLSSYPISCSGASTVIWATVQMKPVREPIQLSINPAKANFWKLRPQDGEFKHSPVLWSGHGSTDAGTGEEAGDNRGPHFHSHQQPSPTYSWEIHAAAARGKVVPHGVHTEVLAGFSWMAIVLPVYKSERIGILTTDGEDRLNHIPIAGVERRQARSLQLCRHNTKKNPRISALQVVETPQKHVQGFGSKTSTAGTSKISTIYMKDVNGHTEPSSLPEQTPEDDDFRSCTASLHIRKPLSSDRHPKPNIMQLPASQNPLGFGDLLAVLAEQSSDFGLKLYKATATTVCKSS